MKEQIEILIAQANGYMMMARIMKTQGYADSMKSYAKSGKECCALAIELQQEWDSDITEVFKLAA